MSGPLDRSPRPGARIAPGLSRVLAISALFSGVALLGQIIAGFSLVLGLVLTAALVILAVAARAGPNRRRWFARPIG